MEDAIQQHYVYRHRHANHRRQNPISAQQEYIAIDGGTSLRGWRNKPSTHISVPFDLQTLFQSIVLPKPETASGHPPVSSDSLVVHGVLSHVSAINKLAANQPEPQNTLATHIAHGPFSRHKYTLPTGPYLPSFLRARKIDELSY